MVKEKNAKSHHSELMDFLEEEGKRLDAEVIGTRWYVYEYTPGYNTGGYYDVDVPAKQVIVSKFFDTEQEAQDWLGEHEPDPGNELRIGKHHKRRKVTIGWYSY